MPAAKGEFMPVYDVTEWSNGKAAKVSSRYIL